jgi:hypothetical protein
MMFLVTKIAYCGRTDISNDPSGETLGDALHYTAIKRAKRLHHICGKAKSIIAILVR